MGTATSGLVTLTGLRELAAAALEPAAEGDPPIHSGPVDAIEPPALMILWDDPMLTAEGAGCWYRARLAVYAFAGRVEPAPAYAALEGMLEFVIARLRADAYSWPYETARAPRLLEVAGVPLLAARVVYSCPVSIGG